jgi:hypothetical protein
LAVKTSAHATAQVFQGHDVDGVSTATHTGDSWLSTSSAAVQDANVDRAGNSDRRLCESSAGNCQNSQSSYIDNEFVE